MPRRIRNPKARLEVPEGVWNYFLDETGSPSDWESWWIDHPDLRRDSTDPSDLRSFAIWDTCRDEVLELWARERAGHRPKFWWRHEAPAEPVLWHGRDHGGKYAQRQRLGGTGLPEWECGLATGPWYEWGLPQCWMKQETIDVYALMDFQKNRPPHKWPDGAAYNRDDPPIFESQASFLKRHRLLLPGEERRLTPADFEPEKALLVLREWPRSEKFLEELRT
jgi:hypothetical protein